MKCSAKWVSLMICPEALQLFAHEIEFGSLREGTRGQLTYRGRYFVAFRPEK